MEGNITAFIGKLPALACPHLGNRSIASASASHCSTSEVEASTSAAMDSTGTPSRCRINQRAIRASRNLTPCSRQVRIRGCACLIKVGLFGQLSRNSPAANPACSYKKVGFCRRHHKDSVLFGRRISRFSNTPRACPAPLPCPSNRS